MCVAESDVLRVLGRREHRSKSRSDQSLGSVRESVARWSSRYKPGCGIAALSGSIAFVHSLTLVNAECRCNTLGVTESAARSARYRAVSRPGSILWKEDSPKCLQQNDAIQPDGPVADVPRFNLDAIIQSQLIPPAHLPESGNTGPGRENRGKLNADALTLFRQVRARTDQTHLALQNIQELGEFIQAPLPQKATQARDARIIIPQFCVSPPFLGGAGITFEVSRQLFIAVHMHCSELKTAKLASPIAKSFLNEQRRPLGINLDQYSEDQKQGERQ